MAMVEWDKETAALTFGRTDTPQSIESRAVPVGKVAPADLPIIANAVLLTDVRYQRAFQIERTRMEVQKTGDVKKAEELGKMVARQEQADLAQEALESWSEKARKAVEGKNKGLGLEEMDRLLEETAKEAVRYLGIINLAGGLSGKPVPQQK
jgi:hypothetical protein